MTGPVPPMPPCSLGAIQDLCHDDIPGCAASISVAPTYAGLSILLTGVTGFLGKVVLEKLLHSCPDLERVYVLIRPRKSVPADVRFEREVPFPWARCIP